MVNKLNVKYQDGWNLEQFQYANYGSSVTKEQKSTALAQFRWCLQNLN